jgi:hypothetical protein
MSVLNTIKSRLGLILGMTTAIALTAGAMISSVSADF